MWVASYSPTLFFNWHFLYWKYDILSTEFYVSILLEKCDIDILWKYDILAAEFDVRKTTIYTF